MLRVDLLGCRLHRLQEFSPELLWCKQLTEVPFENPVALLEYVHTRLPTTDILFGPHEQQAANRQVQWQGPLSGKLTLSQSPEKAAPQSSWA
jgi:hypothetical protein